MIICKNSLFALVKEEKAYIIYRLKGSRLHSKVQRVQTNTDDDAIKVFNKWYQGS